jgi:hypothetical protein
LTVKKGGLMKSYDTSVHYEVLDGMAVLALKPGRDGKQRNTLGIVVYHFPDEKSARAVAREHLRKVFRVEGSERTELSIRPQGGTRTASKTETAG